ncbi:GTPase RsgA [Candidatus Woesearchaeota archaeon]|jgi:small GTP-binding protein|nr:GTPase RsgA [Candidatus Woesearchaeota archaeon]MBT5342535.1 GTPase RsgA [Candidatus Woesearchaeota archaeon]
MPSFWKHVNKVLQEAEIVIEVLDARMVEETRNFEIEKKIQTLGKKILYVFNKCDLVDKNKFKRIKSELKPSVFISSKDKLGTTILKKKILELSKGNAVTVGIVGYPNVGKSSLINALSGRGSAKTSSESGYTKGFQKIRVDAKILLLDTPGVLPRKEKDVAKHSKTGALSYGKIKDVEGVALELIEEEKKTILEFYKIKDSDDPEEVLEQIAFKFNKLSSGGKANLEVAARMLLKDWQTGKIKS